MTELLTLECFVTRLACYAINPNCETVWRGKKIDGHTSYEQLRTIAKEVAETGRPLHVRTPGPAIRHFIVRDDVSIDGSYCFEVA